MRARAYPLAMIVVGISFIPLGISRYPAFILIGILYMFIGLRGIAQALRAG